MSRIIDLRNKDVININDGTRIGIIYDAEFDLDTAKITSVIVPGPAKYLGIFGRTDIIIKWSDIKKIGDDTVLVNYDLPEHLKRKKKKKIVI